MYSHILFIIRWDISSPGLTPLQADEQPQQRKHTLCVNLENLNIQHLLGLSNTFIIIRQYDNI